MSVMAPLHLPLTKNPNCVFLSGFSHPPQNTHSPTHLFLLKGAKRCIVAK